jgi:NitT/TauT family transport system permease protein
MSSVADRFRSPAFVRAVVLFGALAVLEIACRAGFVNPTTLISPSQMVISLAKVLQSGKYTWQIWSTLSNVAIATVISVVFGIAAGIAVHATPRIRRALEPFLASCYAVPGFIFYVPLLGIFGLNRIPLIAIGVILGMPAMVIATLNGLDAIPNVLLRLARMYRMGVLETVFKVKLPSTAPHLFSGIRLCVAYAFIGVLASEFILSDRGVGYSIAYAYHDFDVRTMYALMLFVVLAVTGANMVLQHFETRMRRKREV